MLKSNRILQKKISSHFLVVLELSEKNINQLLNDNFSSCVSLGILYIFIQATFDEILTNNLLLRRSVHFN